MPPSSEFLVTAKDFQRKFFLIETFPLWSLLCEKSFKRSSNDNFLHVKKSILTHLRQVVALFWIIIAHGTRLD